MADDVLGIDLLLTLPGVQADRSARSALRLLDTAMADGDTCLDLGETLRTEPGLADDVAAWKRSLLASGLVTEGAGGRPLVLDGDLLSSRRYWRYEGDLAAALCTRAADLSRLDRLADPAFTEDLRTVFPAKRDARVDGVDWQRLAATVALVHGLAVITGGPGTGKTTVAGKAIAIAARHAARAGKDLRVVIAAPTGKAAQRLRESLIATGRSLVANGFLSEAQLAALTRHVATLHRLLRDRHLAHADLVVIDEVSMADAATLSRTFARIPATAQVILLGDPRQLASVDAGHVLGEIARLHDDAVHPRLRDAYLAGLARPEPVALGLDLHPLALCQVHLRRNWRSAASPAVTALAAAMQESPLQVQCVLGDPQFGPEAGRRAEGRPVWVAGRPTPSATEVARTLLADLADWADAVVSAPTPEEALAAHGRQRVLCARRSGPLGAEWFNAAIEADLARRGRILPWDDGHYAGRPLLMTRNDYDLQLSNGDIGIIHGRRGEAQAWFTTGTGELRPIPLHRLHSIEPVFAMSIHKSQGSQFDHVEIVTALDDHGGTGELLTRELLYTAVTRAAYSARIWADPDLLARALDRRTVRRSGLGHFLRNALPASDHRGAEDTEGHRG